MRLPPQILTNEDVTTYCIMKQWNVGVTERAGWSETSVHGVAFRDFFWSLLRECEGGKEKQRARNDNRLTASVPGNLVDNTVLFEQVNRSWRNTYFTKLVLLRQRHNAFVSNNHLKSSGQYIYQQFNIQQSYVLPTRCIYVLMCGSENKQQLFPYTALTGLFL